MNTIVSLLISCISLVANPSGPSNITKLPTIADLDNWDCFVRNDTVTFARQGDWISFLTIVRDSIVDKTVIPITDPFVLGTSVFAQSSSSVACLHKEDDELYLFESRANNEVGVINTKIPSLHTSQFTLIPMDSSYLAVFGDYSKRFTLNSHSLSHEYGGFSCCRLEKGTTSNPQPIESGRVFSYWFQYVVVDDTVYAAWQQGKHKSFMTIMTGVEDNIVVARYDGTSWSRPEPILALTSDNGVRVLGIYEINKQLYVFWSESQPGGPSQKIFYMKSQDRKRWSSPAPLTSCSGFIQSWLACSDGRGKLHLVISHSKGQLPKYYTFDGENLDHRYDLDLGDGHRVAGIHSIAADKGRIYLFYQMVTPPGKDDSHRITKFLVNEEGDTERVDIFGPLTEDKNESKTELYMLKL